MDEVTPGSVRTEAHSVEGATQLGLVLGVSDEVAQLVEPVSELTLVSVLALPALLVRSAEFCLVPETQRRPFQSYTFMDNSRIHRSSSSIF